MEEVSVKQPGWVLEYEGKDVTTDVSPYMLDITYTDVLEGEADNLDISLEDRDHQWKNGWWPQRSDKVRLAIGYEGEALVNCGVFQVDEVELNGPPDAVKLRALSAGVKEALRTLSTVAYEKKTLKQIAKEIAGKHGLTLTGNVSEEKAKRRPQRITQRNEHDLAFLRRLGKAEGVIFTVKDEQLVWHDLFLLDAAEAISRINRPDTSSYRFRVKTDQVYKACEVRYHDPKTKKTITYTHQAEGVKTGDTLKIYDRCESKADAIIKAKAALRNRNGAQVEGTISLPGAPLLAAGTNVEIVGFGVLDGIYQIIKARHTMSRGGGYKTDIDIHTTTTNSKSLEQ